MLYKDIEFLFKNKGIFSKLISLVNLNEVEFIDSKSREWELCGITEGRHSRLVIIDNSKGVQESFATLFKYVLFYWEGWLEEEMNLTDKIKWIEALKNIWIPEYFRNKYLVLEKMQPNTFFEDSGIEKDFPEEYRKIRKSQEGIRVTDEGYKLFTGVYFGMTDEIYYYYESFIND